MTNTPSPYFIKRTASPAPADPEALVLNEGMVVQHEEFSLLDYWRLIACYRWLVLACTLATLAATALYLFTRTPIYTAETTILIERQPNSIVKIQDASDGISVNPWDDGEFQKTQQEILKSRALAARVIQEEGLESHGLFTLGLHHFRRLSQGVRHGRRVRVHFRAL